MPGTVRGERFFGMGIQLAGADVPFDRGIELGHVEGFEPGAKARELARGKLFNGFLDVFGGGHSRNIAFVTAAEKAIRRADQLIRRPFPRSSSPQSTKALKSGLAALRSPVSGLLLRVLRPVASL